MTDLNATQRTALLTLADLTPKYTGGVVPTGRFAHPSTASALAQRGLLAWASIPRQGYQLTDAGHAYVTEQRGDEPVVLEHEDTPAEAALRDLLIAANSISPQLICSRFREVGLGLVERLQQAAQRAQEFYPGEGKLTEIPVVAYNAPARVRDYRIAHNFALGPPERRKTVVIGGQAYLFELDPHKDHYCYRFLRALSPGDLA